MRSKSLMGAKTLTPFTSKKTKQGQGKNSKAKGTRKLSRGQGK
jgi:hypothetical protein